MVEQEEKIEMAEEKVQQENAVYQQQKRERFEFKLTVNDNIVCQRYFHINNFKWRSLMSSELEESIYNCVEIIKEDLKRKSKIFLWNTAPSIFNTMEDMMEQQSRVPVAGFVIIKDSEPVYVWDGKKLDPYDGYYNKSDYLKTESDGPCVLKFAFYDNGKEVISRAWDGSIYPRFVRTNIDLSNSKNKYDGSGNIFAPFESALIKMMIDGQPDLIPQIVHELCTCCSHEDDADYTTKMTYGNKTYNLNINSEWNKYVGKLEAKYQRKTEKYFKNL